MESAPLRLLPPTAIDILDQTRLPAAEVRLTLRTVGEVCAAIRSLQVRGAPLLGIAGAAGLALAASERGPAAATLEAAARELTGTRPTAVDLAMRTNSALGAALALPEAARRDWLWENAARLIELRRTEDLALGAHGATVIATHRTVLTHCNAGGLATGGAGTALAVIRCAFERGTLAEAYAMETRPLLQGARLTMWELARAGVPARLVPDTAGAALISSGAVGCVVTGADRIARNGDAANKIGTYQLALAAREHGVPFFIAAPRSTFDEDCAAGHAIPIEFRDDSEVGGFGEQRWSPPGTRAYNPAFDVTPARFVSGFITESGLLGPPFAESIPAYLEREPVTGSGTYTVPIRRNAGW